MTDTDDTPVGCNCRNPDVYGHSRNCPHHETNGGYGSL
jgi:hypothetical protein